MKRFILNSVMFLAIFFVVEKSSYYLLYKAPDKEVDKRLEQVVNGEMNKELIVLGSSRGAGNIIAGQLEKETGLSAFNLSYQGTNIEFHDFILTTLLKYNKAPKKLLLCIDSPHAFFKEKSLGFRVDPLFPLAANNYINDELIKRGENSRLSKLFCLGRITKNNFDFKQKKQRSINPIDNYGSMPLLKMSETGEALMFSSRLIDYTLELESQEKLKAFKHIQQSCEAYDIELVCVFSPSFRKFHQEFFKRVKLLLHSNNKVFTYDLELDIYTDANYFYDNEHLNVIGAKIFTSELSAFLNKK